MTSIVVAGVVNVQQIIPVDGFPVPYTPVRYVRDALRLEVAGVGANVARGLAALGDQVRLATLLGDDAAGGLARTTLAREGLTGPGILGTATTAQSAVLVAPDGRRHIVTDLAGLPEASYPPDTFRALLDGAELASISTIGFARDLLPIALAAGVPIAVDLQATSGLDDAYGADWIDAATIVFASAERLTTTPEQFAADVLAHGQRAHGRPARGQRVTRGQRVNGRRAGRQTRIVVIGLGADGCLLAVAGGGPPRRIAAHAPLGVVDTTGAGDALFTGFLHAWLCSRDPDDAITMAIRTAGWAVAFPGTSHYATHADLARLDAGAAEPL
ncbi:acarbose 7IV-phosphotransferase [Frankia sp. AiPs1]|uniref:carbohydrate kinase family protein n=1 Tax=Frankia sp. AiPa1 TaxID=573492 RepID=UPI00202B8F92|nr:PfkB family carbohydrate kinase [Frankia sp. AiPa1]MCL9759457.1 carbohydrate kinase family protein [Frankia sp. AiPa1]